MITWPQLIVIPVMTGLVAGGAVWFGWDLAENLAHRLKMRHKAAPDSAPEPAPAEEPAE